MEWNEKLKQARLEKGLSQKDAATQLQMSRTGLANYEQGVREPSFDAIRRLCKFYDISADYLIGLSEY
ncbi:MAG: helix-turn-helix domain-containing protein [Clostridiales bacterium]|nr:helix-turn-helix domain-containing protein [Clostridiales bacterium]